MKRILSVLLCIGMLLGMCSFGATANGVSEESELFAFFEDEITFISLFTGHVAQGEKYPAGAVIWYVQNQLDLEKYGVGEPMGDEEYIWYDVYSVPADVFEAEAALHFEVDDTLIQEIRAYQGGLWDEETQTVLPIYDATIDSYVFYMGGLGDSLGYSTYGYVKNGDRYDVYLYYVERGYALTEGAVLGEDYLFEEDWDGSVRPIEILERAKFAVEYDGEDLKFLWSETIDAFPAIDGMVVREPVEVIMDGDFIYRPMNDGKELWLCAHQRADAAEVTIPAAVDGVPVTAIVGEVFSWRDALTKVTLPDSLTTIGDYVFSGCWGLTEIDLPAGITTIGDYAFSDCGELSDVALPVGLTTIGDGAFAYAGLTKVEIPAGVTSIGDEAFYACPELTAIDVAEGNVAYASEDGVLFNKSMTTLMCYPAGKTAASYVIPEGVTTIARGAFRDAFLLTQVTIPESVTTIKGVAFAYSGLTSVEIPAGVTEIEEYTFDGCSSLESVTFNRGLTRIGEGAFMFTGLTSVVIPEGVTEIGHSAFGTYSLASVVFPGSLQKIGDYSFPGGETLTSAVYIGTEEEWALVEKGMWSSGETEAVVTFAAPLKDETSGVQVFNGDGETFAADITLSVQPVTDEETLSKLEEYDNAMVLDITLLKNGAETQPEAAVTVRVPVPEGFDGENCRVFRVEEDGTLTDMNAYFMNGMLVFTTEHFSHYAVVETGLLLGDVDGSGKINTTDARKILQFVAEKIEEDALDTVAADVDKNGKINTTDARKILQFVAEKIDSFT